MNQKLSLWETPFSNSRLPSVGLYIEHGEDETDLVSAIVAPDGIDQYPKYLISFGEALEFSCYEEGCCPDRGYEALIEYPQKTCGFKWIGSPSVEAYQALMGDSQLNHYLIIGADNIVEVVSGGAPIVTTIDSPTEIEVKLHI